MSALQHNNTKVVWINRNCEDYIDVIGCTVCRGSFEQMPLSREQLRNEVDLLHNVLPNIGSPVVFCHNDLLLKNVIYDEEQSEY